MWLVQDPIHLGVVILDKLVKDLMKKIPSKKKGNIEDEDESIESEDSERTDPSVVLKRLSDEEADDDEDGDEDGEESSQSSSGATSIIDTLKKTFNSVFKKHASKYADKIIKKATSKKTSADGTGVVEKESTPEKTRTGVISDKTGIALKKKSKKPSPIIIGVVVLGLLSLFLLPEDEEPVQTPVVTKPKPKDNPPADTNVVETSPAPDAPVAPDPVSPDPVAVEPDPVMGTETPVVEQPVIEAPVETPMAETPIAEPEAPVMEDPVTEAPPIVASEDSVTEDIPANTSNENLTDKILEDLEKQVKTSRPKVESKVYVAPPDYEYKGRALVYNCIGKHWACVDAPSFRTCESNHASPKKQIECFPFNVYETQKGCELMQNRVVSSGAKTNFCKGN